MYIFKSLIYILKVYISDSSDHQLFSANGGFRLLVPSDRAVICSAKPLRSYLLADSIKRYINKLIIIIISQNSENWRLSQKIENSQLW